MMRQGISWDLMAWSFSARWSEKGPSTKTQVQLQQEAAIVLALGGGFQIYCKQKRDASIEEWLMETIAGVAKFCRERQAICHKAEGVPQVALLYSRTGLYSILRRVFGQWDGELTPMCGILDALCDGQQVVEITMEHQLAGRMDEYPAIVIPEWEHLGEEFPNELLAYVRRGGNLLVMGPAAAKNFEKQLGVELLGEPQEKGRYLEVGRTLGGLATKGVDVKLAKGTRAIAHWREGNDFVGPRHVAATRRRLGKGSISGLYLEFGKQYERGRTAAMRDFLAAILREVHSEPMVEVTGSHLVDVNLMRKDGDLFVHLVNTAGPHADDKVYTFDEIPKVGPLEISVRLPAKPRALTLEPGAEKLSWKWAKGEVKLTVPPLEIHRAIRIRE